MALTRITKGVIKPNENYDTHNINSTGIVTATKFVGPFDNINVSGAATFSGNVSIAGTLTYEDVTNVDSVGIITARDGIHVGAGVSAVGVGTFGSLDIGGDIDVDGHTNLDNVSIAGITTMTGNLHVANSQPSIYLNDLDSENDYSLMNNNGAFVIRDNDRGVNAYELLANGTNKFNGLVNIVNGLNIDTDLDVDGHTNLDNVSIAGVTTTTGNLNVTDGRILIAQSSVPQLRINSSAADGSSTRFTLGLATGSNNFINGAVANDACITAPQEVKFGIGNNLKFRISNNLIANTDVIPNGNNVRSLGLSNYRWSDLYSVDANISGDLDVDGHTNLDNVSVAGVTTFTGEVSITGQNLTLQGGHPNLYLTDTDHDSDFVISNSNSSFVIKDIQNNVNRIKIFTAGNTEIVGDLDIGDSIRHIGDTDTKIRFPAADTIQFETSGSSRLKIDDNGKVLIATTTTSEAHANQDELIIGNSSDDANHGLTIVTPSGRYGTVAFSDGSGGNSQGLLEYNHSGDYFRIYTGGTGEKLRITSDGKIGVNYAGTPPSETMMIASADSTTGLSISHSSGGNRYGARLSTISGTNKGLIISNIFNSSYTEAFRINSNGDVTTTGQASFDRQNAGFTARAGDAVSITRASGTPLEINRTGSDGQMISLMDDNTQEAAIAISSGALQFGTPNSNNPRLAITSGGTVNIGGDYTNTTGKLKVTGVVTVDGGFNLTAGTLTAPGGFSISSGNVIISGDIAHDADSDTKFGFGSGADTFRIDTAGSRRIYVDSSGRTNISKNGYTGSDMTFALTVHTGATSETGPVNDGIMIVSQQNSGNQNSTTGKLMFCGHAQTNGPFLYGDSEQAYGKKGLVFHTLSTANSYSTQLEETARFTYTGRFGLGTGTAVDSLMHIQGNSDNGDEACQLTIEDEDTTAGSKIPSIQFKGNGTNTCRIRGTDLAGISFATWNGSSQIERSTIGNMQEGGAFLLNADDRGWATFRHNHNQGLRTHIRQHYAPGNSVSTYKIMRIRRHNWGWGTYKITLKALYYYGSHETTYYVNGHGAGGGDNYSIQKQQYGGNNMSNDYGAATVTKTSASTSSPGNSSTSYIDVQVNVPNYMYLIVYIEAYSSGYSTDPSNIGSDSYCLSP